MRTPGIVIAGLIVVVGTAVSSQRGAPVQAGGQVSVAAAPTTARATNGKYISWREHIIDDEAAGGVAIRGGDGLKMADLDKDGYLDIVSVHEADTQYDGALNGLHPHRVWFERPRQMDADHARQRHGRCGSRRCRDCRRQRRRLSRRRRRLRAGAPHLFSESGKGCPHQDMGARHSACRQ